MKSKFLAAAILFLSAVAICPKSYSQDLANQTAISTNTLYELQTGLDALYNGNGFYTGRPYEYGLVSYGLNQFPDFSMFWTQDDMRVFVASELISNHVAQTLFNNEGSSGAILSSYTELSDHLEKIDHYLNIENNLDGRVRNFFEFGDNFATDPKYRNQFREDITTLRSRILEPIFRYSFAMSNQATPSEVSIKSMLPALFFVNEATALIQTLDALEKLRSEGSTLVRKNPSSPELQTFELEVENLTKIYEKAFSHLKDTYFGVSETDARSAQGKRPQREGMFEHLQKGSDFYSAIREMVREVRNESASDARRGLADLNGVELESQFENAFYQGFAKAIEKYKLTPKQQQMVLKAFSQIDVEGYKFNTILSSGGRNKSGQEANVLAQNLGFRLLQTILREKYHFWGGYGNHGNLGLGMLSRMEKINRLLVLHIRANEGNWATYRMANRYKLRAEGAKEAELQDRLSRIVEIIGKR